MSNSPKKTPSIQSDNINVGHAISIQGNRILGDDNRISVAPSSIQVTELREAPSEREYRLRREEADAELNRWKEKSLFIVSIIVALAVTIVCVWIIANPNSLQATSDWARSIMTLTIGGFVGYLTGKATK